MSTRAFVWTILLAAGLNAGCGGKPVKGVHDWQDLVLRDISIITPNPKTSGNGKRSFLAAWGPSNPTTLAAHTERLPELKLFDITAIAPDWEAAQRRFFAEGALFDTIYQPESAPPKQN